MLMIEEAHYNQLNWLMNQFEKFGIWKIKLVELRNNTKEEILNKWITKNEIQNTINANKKWKKRYDKIILDIGKTFREQIKW